MKVKVNKDNCIGCGACEAIYPEVFQINDDGLSTVICDHCEKMEKEKIMEAMESCPTSAIEECNE